MEAERVEKFVREWLDAWNAHDVEAVLAHFADDVLFTSPVAARLLPETGGTLRGKEALRGYWQEGVRQIPDLRFELLGTYVGVDTIAINYRNQASRLVNEVLRFSDGLVVEGHGTYLTDEPARPLNG